MAQIVKPKDFKKDTVKFFMSRKDALVERMMYRRGFDLIEDIGDIEYADVVVFGGGPDINPFLYGERRNKRTYIDYTRDIQDLAVLRKCKDYQQLVGICRGAQFLNVMVGNGRLYQHVDNHANGYHTIVELDAKDNVTDRRIRVSSTHHQMMIPGTGANVIAVAQQALQKYTMRDEPAIDYSITDRMEYYDDYEVLWYSNYTVNALCFQPHPEYNASDNKECESYFFELMHKYILTKSQSENVQYEQLAREG